MGKHTQSIDTKVLDRIQAKGPGYVFTAADLLDVGSRDAVDQALSRNCRAGKIRKVARGIYDLPQRNARIGDIAASSDAIASAIARRDAARLQPTGANAANVLGLCDQVPMRIVYLTDGRSRRAKVGRREIILKHTTPRNMATAGRISGTVIQALRWLGQRHIDDNIIRTLQRRLPDDAKKQLIEDLRYAPAWIAAIMRKVAEVKGAD
jgi:predicted transcriptional regulator of viral defense system